MWFITYTHGEGVPYLCEGAVFADVDTANAVAAGWNESFHGGYSVVWKLEGCVVDRDVWSSLDDVQQAHVRRQQGILGALPA